MIVAENVSIELPIIGAARSFRSEMLVGKVGGLLRKTGGNESSSRRISVSALQDLSFKIEPGDRVGLLGHNGAGKSTLLRVLARLYAPTSGRLRIDGRVTPLLALGTGMDNEFSGYDNIVINGLYLGYSKKDIEARIKQIAEFTELGEFLHLPIRTYSSGMLLRLSFAVATSIEPDILLVDEVFGAGDASFYDRAHQRMDKLVRDSNIFVLASHSTALITQYCNKAVVMEKGRMAYFGPTDEGISHYNAMSAR